MKTKTAFWMLAAFAAFSTFGETTPMASQPWVRMVVANETANTKQWIRDNFAEKSGSVDMPPFKFTATDDDGNEQIVSFNYKNATRSALVVKNSDLSSLSNGTFFAKVGEYEYVNYKNPSCQTIVGGVEAWGKVITDGRWVVVTNGSEVTRVAVYDTTNDNYMVRFRMTVNGVNYESTNLRNGVHEFFTVTDDTTFTLVEKKITEDDYNAIAFPPNASSGKSFSILDLLFPSAYAITRMTTDWDGKPTPWYDDVKTGSKTKRTTHYAGEFITDSGDAAEFGLTSVQWGGNTIAVEYKLTDVVAGISIQEVREYHDSIMNDKNQWIQDVKNEIRQDFEAKGQGRMWVNISRALTSDGRNAVDAAINEMFDKFDTWYKEKEIDKWLEKWEEFNKDGTEPIYHYTEVEEWEDEKDEPDPPDPPQNVLVSPTHRHLKPREHECGKYTCAACGASYDPSGIHAGTWPMTHTFQWRQQSGHQYCKWCVNNTPNGYCHASSHNENDHTGWRNIKIKMSESNSQYPGFTSQLSFRENGNDYGYYEICSGTMIKRLHNMSPMNAWRPIVNGNGDYDEVSDARVYHCVNEKYHDSSGEICGFGESGGSDMSRHYVDAGVWNRSSHEWTLPYRVKGGSGSWTWVDENDCKINRICQHMKDANGNNLGCGMSKEYVGSHAWTRLDDLGREQTYFCGTVADGDYERHYPTMICAHDIYYEGGEKKHHGCGNSRPKSPGWIGNAHDKVYGTGEGDERHSLPIPENDEEHLTPVTCEKGCGYYNTVLNPHNHNESGYTNITTETHTHFTKCTYNHTERNPGCGKVIFEKPEQHDDLQYGQWVQVDNFYHAHSIRCKTCDHVIAHQGDTTEHDGLSYAIEKDVFQSYPQQTNFICQTHSEGRYNPDTGEWTPPRFGWIDITGGHIGENPCYTCGGRYQDLTWRACKYESIGSFKHFNQSENVLTCDNCHNEIKTPRLQGLRYLNSTYHADYCCRDIGGAAMRCTPYLDAEEHYHYDDDGNRVRSQPGDYCEGCDTIVESEPFDGNLKIPNGNDDLDDTTFLYICAMLGLRQPLSDNDEPVNNFNGDDPVYRVMPYALEGMFKDCTYLETVYLNYCTNALEGAMKDAFVNCSSLRYCGFDRLELADTESFSGAFSNCHSLARLNLPNLREIGDRSFERNNKLLEVTLPKATNIGERAFADCGRLRYVYFTGCSEIPHLKEPNAFYGLSEDAAIIVPHALYDDWRAATNWSEIANMILSDRGYGTNCDFYVSARIGSDDYDGLTPDTPKRTIDAAISLATNNQVIGVMDGHYAYPDFYDKTQSVGAERPITIVGLSDGNVYIDEPNSSGKAYITGCMRVWTAFENITFRNMIPAPSNRHCFMFSYFYNCVFEDATVTTRYYHATFNVSVLERCKIRNMHIVGTGGSGAGNKNLNPSVFGDTIVYDSEIEFTSPQNPGESDLSLADVGHFDNVYLNGGNVYSMELYNHQVSPNFGEMAMCIDTTMILDGVQKPNGWGYVSDMPMVFTNSLVGVDGLNVNENYHFSSVITNKATMAGAIDPATKRPDSEHSSWRAYGYRGLPLTFNRSNGKRRSEAVVVELAAPEIENVKEDDE